MFRMRKVFSDPFLGLGETEDSAGDSAVVCPVARMAKERSGSTRWPIPDL